MVLFSSSAIFHQTERYMLYDCETVHHELVPGANAGALQPYNSFVAGTPNAGIDAVWGREAALLSNVPVSPKFQNCGFKRVDTGAVTKLAPVNAIFVRSQVLSRWVPQAANGTSRPEQSTYANPLLPAPLPEPPPAQPPGYQTRVTPTTIPTTFRVTPSTAPSPTPVAPQPTFSSPTPRGFGQSRYPDPGPAPVAAPSSPAAPSASAASPSSMPPALPNPNPLRRSTRERTSVTPHNATKSGSDGGGLMKHHTEVGDVYSVGETRTQANLPRIEHRPQRQNRPVQLHRGQLV